MILKQTVALICFFFMTCFAKAQDTTVIKFRESQTGVNVITAFINDSEIDMIFDTGAERVTIPKSKAKLLEKLGILTADDYTGKNTKHIVASGDTVSGREIIFREFKLGDMMLYDVVGSVINRDSADVLMGQTVLRQFTSYAVENVHQTITFIYDSTRFQKPVDTVAIDCKIPLMTPQYAKVLGIKSIDQFWSENDINHTIEVLEKIARLCPAQLPRRNGNDYTNALFQRITEQRELMDILKKSVRSAEFKVQTINTLWENQRRLSVIYKKDTAEIMSISRRSLDIAEQVLYFNRDRQTQFSEDTLLVFQKHLSSNLNTGYVLFQDFIRNDFYSADYEAFLIKLVELTPLIVKFVNQPELKTTYTDRLFLLAQFEKTPSVKTALDKGFKALLPKNVSSKTEEDRELLWKRLKSFPEFAKACLLFEGRFTRSDKMDKISYRITGETSGMELLLRIDKNDLLFSGRIQTNEGNKQTPEYNMSKENPLGYLQKTILFILPKLYEWSVN